MCISDTLVCKDYPFPSALPRECQSASCQRFCITFVNDTFMLDVGHITVATFAPLWMLMILVGSDGSLSVPCMMNAWSDTLGRLARLPILITQK